MTKDEKRIAIAEKCGHKRPTGDTCYGPRWLTAYVESLPNYPEDLNAMHDAWNTLTDDQKVTFAKKLGNNPKFCELRKTYVVTRLHLLLGASAEDYADAFLLTHGLTL